MIFKHLQAGLAVDDPAFDAMYSRRMRQVAAFHFTPVAVAKVAAQYLADRPGARVLDIGSGAGKFCMIGAACTQGLFVGVEQRLSLHRLAERLSLHYALPNVRFIRSNITEVDFQAFDAVYFFNAFQENVIQSSPIDRSVPLDKPLYRLYSEYVRGQLAAMPSGTRLATYFSYGDEVPETFRVLETDFDGKLKLWEKRG
ncbi:MAG: class I SAM-dependent methyltransferase [Saprospiraceae bacterium]|nr:class I SAM-dependent methyltransferase [Saprospiraceae bacterium]